MNLILVVLFIYFLASTIYVLALSIAGLFDRKTDLPFASTHQRIAILIPAYMEDGVIVSSAMSMLQIDYPKDKYDVFIIADSLQHKTLQQLYNLPIQVIEVSFNKSTKAKALNEAMKGIDASYDIAVISDADNILEHSFLTKINSAFIHGYSVVQGQRIAKNLNTPYAILDAYSEVVNNHLFRKGANRLNISASLIGSGMAFRFAELKRIMLEIDAVGGFDKMLQLKLIDQGEYIKYYESAIVYDEKVDNPSDLQNQRKRWNVSQYRYLKKYFFKGLTKLLQGNISYFNLSVLSSLFLSRVLSVGLIFLLTILISIFSNQVTFIVAWWFLLGGYVLALALPLYSAPFKVNILSTLLYLPHVFIIMVKSIVNSKNADKAFIHTPHNFVEAHTVNTKYRSSE